MRYTEEQREFLKNHIVGHSSQQTAQAYNEFFGTDYMTPGKVNSYKGNNNLKNGLDTRFKKGNVPHNKYEKGNIPHNKGKKGVCGKGCEKTWFKKGTIPHNTRPVGSESVLKGYVKVKVAEPNKWKLKQRYIWEQHYGEIPPKMKVIFKDGNRLNFDIDNLALVSYGELAYMNKRRLASSNCAELTELGITVAKLGIETNKKKRKRNGK